MYPTRFSCFRPLSWSLAVGLLLSARASLAQETVPAPALTLDYQSVFAKYKKFDAQDVAIWRKTNNEVEQIGGWRAYAKEVNRPDPVEPSANGTTSADGKAMDGSKP